MARFVTGKTFGTTETVTAALLNQAVNDAAISTDSVDGSTIEVNSNALRIKDNGITTAKIADNAVTLAKMATQADQTVLGNVSGGTAVPTAVPIVGAAGILINDDALGTSDTKGATQGNIKAYVDTTAGPTVGFTPTASASDTKSVTLPNGLIMKFGRVSASASGTTTVNFSDFGGNFTNNVFSVVITVENSTSGTNTVILNAQPSTSSFVIKNQLTSTEDVNFIAIGR